jgi:hypothetical protein
MVRSLIRHAHPALVGDGSTAPTDLTIMEPCAGDGAIVNELKNQGFRRIFTNDIDEKRKTDFNFDAAGLWPTNFPDSPTMFDWTVSNPPWAMPKGDRPLPVNILKYALQRSNRAVSMLLRITFLEPCANRGAWLRDQPPDQIIVLPRYSFTGDGKSDSATACWMTWHTPFLREGRHKPIVIDADAERL